MSVKFKDAVFNIAKIQNTFLGLQALAAEMGYAFCSTDGTLDWAITWDENRKNFRLELSTHLFVFLNIERDAFSIYSRRRLGGIALDTCIADDLPRSVAITFLARSYASRHFPAFYGIPKLDSESDAAKELIATLLSGKPN